MSNSRNKAHRKWLGPLGLTLILLCVWTRLEMAAFGSVLDFDAATAASIVATTGLSEVLGDVILIAKNSCGTNADAFCVNEAETIQVHYSNILIDNSPATGMMICEALSTNSVCNEPGDLLTGVFTFTEGTISIGVRQGANLAAFDRLTIGGVRARIATGVMRTPNFESVAVVSAIPGFAASFPPDTLVTARSASPLLIQVTAVPEIPCTEEGALPAVLVTEGYTTAFVDYGDSLERSRPGLPLPPRVPLGANVSTRISLTVSGLAPGIEIHWPIEVIAQNSASVLELISQSADGSSATYVYGTPNQFESDSVSEFFAVRLRPENFSFSGSDELSGIVSVQGQLLPPAIPENIRPRFDHPLSPDPGPPFFLMKRCAPPGNLVGSAEIRATVDGQDWTGSLHVHLEGPVPRNSSLAPQTVEDLPSGTYALLYLSGGPAGAQLADITPNSIRTIPANGSADFSFNFTGPTIANLQLSAMPLAVCPAANTAVGTFQVANVTGDTQIIPAAAALVFTFSSPVAALPATSGFENATVSSSITSVQYDFPEGLSLPSGSVLTFSGTGLDLSGNAAGQDVTVLLTSLPSEAVQLSSNQTKVATTDLAACPPPPSFLSAGITNGASFEPGVAVGSISTLFGEHLTDAAGIALASKIPLPEQIDGTSVTVNGMAVPLFAVANVNGQEQINFQVPWEVTGQETVSVIVNNSGLASDPVEVSLLPILPGIFTTDGSAGAILHGADSALVTASNPASPGEVVTIFATGLGPVSATPATGAAALVEPLSITAFGPAVTVAGMQAIVEFSGLAPDFVGLYQVNITLPPGVPAGIQEVVLQVAGQSSKPATVAIQ